MVGLVLWFIGAAVIQQSFDARVLRHGYWVVPWLGGATIIGAFGEYGGNNDLNAGPFGQYTDIVLVIVFSVVVYYWAVATAQSRAAVEAAVRDDEEQIKSGEVLNVPMG